MTKRIFLGIMLVILVCNGLMAQTLTRDKENFYLSEPDEKKADISPGETLVINSATSLSGILKISCGGKNCSVIYRKRLKALGRQEAMDFAAVITVDLNSTNDGLMLALRAPANAPWSETNNTGRLDVEISLPDSCNLRINTAYFDVEASGPFVDFVVSESLSRVSVEDVARSTNVKISSRPLSVKKARGDLFISNEYGKIELEDINTGDQLGTVRNDHAEISITNFRGGLDLGNSYETIAARNLFLTGTRNRVKNISGPIILEFDSLTIGRLRVNNNYGRTAIEIPGPIDARFICKNGLNSRIIVDGFTVEPMLVEQRRLEFSSGDGTAEVRIYTQGEGDIIIQGPGKTDIRGEI